MKPIFSAMRLPRRPPSQLTPFTKQTHKSLSTDLPKPKSLFEYTQKQKLLPGRSQPPQGFEDFRTLREDKRLAFRDITIFFRQMNALEPTRSASVALIRGRRWGKTVLGEAWLAFLSLNLAEKPEDKFLFEGTSVEHQLRKTPLLPLKLDVSQCQSVEHLVQRFADQIQLVAPQITLPPPSRLFPDDPNLAPLIDFADLCWTLRSHSSRFALFIDEYDYLIISALQDGDIAAYTRLNDFFAKFLTTLKSHLGDSIPFQFITGSSRLVMKGFWSGPSNILDLSMLPGSAEALGYTWESLYACYSTQISWLASLDGLPEQDFRKKMEAWYNHHRWSPENPTQVFNPWSIDCFIRTGVFDTYWANTSSPPIFFSHLLVEQLLRALLQGDCSIDYQSLGQPHLLVDQGKTQQIPIEQQLSLLVEAGMLSISDTYDPISALKENNPRVPLKIPNLDAKQAILKLLATAVPVQPAYLADGGYFIKNRDFINPGNRSPDLRRS